MSNIRNDDKNEMNIKNEVRKLIKEGYKFDSNLISHLTNKYSEKSIVDVILEQFKDKKTKLEKIANYFIRKFQEKYGYGMPMTVVLKKILKYKKRYELTDDEFDNVKMMFEKKLYNENNPNYDVNMGYNNNLSRVLGSPFSLSNDYLKPSSNEDFKNVQEIIKLNRSTRALYSQVVLQTSIYGTDNYLLKYNGINFDYKRHSPYVHIHPVIVALFVPKIVDIEMRMLYSNIAEIVECRYEKKPIDTEPNNRLLYYLVNDPSDIVCSTRSPLDDLRERVIVQIQLWQNILNLRNGNIFDPINIEFLNAIDKCKISNFDNPDLIMLGDEGVVLRRLFNIFSFRPIVVQTMPYISNFNNNPYNIPSMNNLISTIPYITKKITPNVDFNPFNANRNVLANPADQNNEDNQEKFIDITENTNSFNQYFLENNMFVLKQTTILDINGPLIFYIPRRGINVPIILPPNIRNLPITKYSNLKVLKDPKKFTLFIDLQKIPSITKKTLSLQSIISIKVNEIKINDLTYSNNNNNNIINGNNTFIFDKFKIKVDPITKMQTFDNTETTNIDNKKFTIYKYTPQDILLNDENNRKNFKSIYINNLNDIIIINENDGDDKFNNLNLNIVEKNKFKDLLETTATIFIYSDTTPDQLVH